MTKIKQSLDSFDWDAMAKEADFFGENAPEGMILEDEKTSKTDKEEKPGEVDPTKEPEGSKEKTENEDEDGEDLFADLSGETLKSTEEDETKGVEKTSATSYKDLYTSLKSSGILEVEGEEDEAMEVTQDLLAERIEQSIEKRFEESIKGLPGELKNIIKFVSNGGNFYDIVSNYTSSENLNPEVDMTDEVNQERVLRAILEEEGKDDELIDSQIEFYKDSGKLESIANKYFDKWKEDREKEVEAQVEQQRLAKQQAAQNQKAFKKELTTFISESESVKGLSINKKDAEELPDYISNTTVKLQDGRQITPFYRDLFEAFKDKEKVVILAKLVKNGFDFGDIKKEVSTKQAREIKNELQRQNKNQPKEAHKTQKRLVDLID